jgi:hypothetical protein
VDGVSLGHIREFTGDVIGNFKALFRGGGAPDSKEAGAAADVFIFTCVTTIELPLMRSYIETVVVGSKVAVAWNLELDTLRGDLGLPGWPPKTLHLEFLSQLKPAFYVRPRDYSKSVSIAPFIINYSGALFREYPGPWQVGRGSRAGAAGQLRMCARHENEVKQQEWAGPSCSVPLDPLPLSVLPDPTPGPGAGDAQAGRRRVRVHRRGQRALQPGGCQGGADGSHGAQHGGRGQL